MPFIIINVIMMNITTIKILIIGNDNVAKNKIYNKLLQEYKKQKYEYSIFGQIYKVHMYVDNTDDISLLRQICHSDIIYQIMDTQNEDDLTFITWKSKIINIYPDSKIINVSDEMSVYALLIKTIEQFNSLYNLERPSPSIMINFFEEHIENGKYEFVQHLCDAYDNYGFGTLKKRNIRKNKFIYFSNILANSNLINKKFIGVQLYHMIIHYFAVNMVLTATGLILCRYNDLDIFTGFSNLNKFNGPNYKITEYILLIDDAINYAKMNKLSQNKDNFKILYKYIGKYFNNITK